jgi:hypothetical protein
MIITPIYIKSKKNGFKVGIGYYHILKNEIQFDITPERFFERAGAFGIDKTVFERKSVKNADKYHFKFTFGDKEFYTISKTDFLANCWLYPPKNNKDYVANSDVFEPKWVLTKEKALLLTQNL